MMEPTAETLPPYPACILPLADYLDFIAEEELWSAHNGLEIQRRCAEDVAGSIMTPEVFGDKLAEMSVNLLGGYWHCQIEIAPACEGGKTVSKEKAEWQKEALKALTNYLVGYASFHHKNPIPMVKKEWYMKHPA